MKFAVRGEEFDITFVNNYVREKYQEMLDLVDELTDLPGLVDEVAEDSERNEKEKRAAFRDIRKRQRGLTKQIALLRRDMLEELLTTNGYDYDAKWWDHNTTSDDINNFVLDCLHKDVTDSKGGGAKKR